MREKGEKTKPVGAMLWRVESGRGEEEELREGGSTRGGGGIDERRGEEWMRGKRAKEKESVKRDENGWENEKKKLLDSLKVRDNKSE